MMKQISDNIKNSRNKRIKEIVLYIVFGILTTLVSWGTYTAFINLCDFSVVISNILSWVCAVVFAFVTNKLWVFESKSLAVKVLAKEITTFVSSRLLTGVIEVFGASLCAKLGFDGIFYGILRRFDITLNVLYTDGIYSKIVFAVIVVILNYIFSKLIIFKRGSNSGSK